MESEKLADCSHEERKDHPRYCFECIKSENMKEEDLPFNEEAEDEKLSEPDGVEIKGRIFTSEGEIE